MLRNSVVFRIHFAIKIIKYTIAEVDQFAKEYLYNPFTRNITHADSSSWKHWIDKLYHASLHKKETGKDLFEETSLPVAMSPIATATVYQLHHELKRLERQLNIAATLLKEYKLEEAFRLSASFEMMSWVFKDYVLNEIDEAENELLCCYLRHDVVHSNSRSYTSYAILGGIGLLVFGIVVFYVNPNRSRNGVALQTKFRKG